MTLRNVVFTLLLAAPFGADATTTWTADPARSTLAFSASADGEAFTGTFKTFEAKIAFDPADLATSSFDVSIDLTSADSGNSDRDDTLQGEEFFNSATQPQAKYKATNFVAHEGGRFSAEGELELNGVSKPVTLEFTWSGDGKSATLMGETVLDRLDFNVGTGDWEDAATITHEVTVKTTLQLSAQ